VRAAVPPGGPGSARAPGERSVALRQLATAAALGQRLRATLGERFRAALRERLGTALRKWRAALRQRLGRALRQLATAAALGQRLRATLGKRLGAALRQRSLLGVAEAIGGLRGTLRALEQTATA
jgi:hypothetical protein